MATKHPSNQPRWIEYVPLDQLPDHPDNPRHHDIAELRASIRRFGFTNPPMIDGRTGLLAEGHGRKQAALDMRADGEPAPPGVTTDAKGGWLVPVVVGWSSVSDAQAKAYLLAGNQAGGYDTQLLADLLADLANTDGLAGTGFDTDDLDQMLVELGAGELPEQDTDADHADTPDRGDPDTPRTKQGMHEVGLAFQDSDYHLYAAAIAQLRERWEIDASPLIVLRALREALDR